MTKLTKVTYEQAKAELKNFSETTYIKYQGYAYAAGYLESLAAELITALPKARQAEVIAQLRRTAGSL